MIGFTGCTVDRADLLRLDPAAIAELAASPEARLLSLAGTDPELDGDGRLLWRSVPAMADLTALIFLGLQNGAALFAPLVAIDQSRPAYAVFRLIEMMPPEEAALWATARSLIAWHGRHGFCANCGAGTDPFRAGWGRVCAACQAQHFPRVDPVVIMLAEHQGRVLLGRQPQYPPGRYSALAGFVEPGESIEEAVAREFSEEAGIKVCNVRYVASQPWPFPGQLMIACIAEAEDDALTIDYTELEDAMWVSRAGVEAAFRRDPQAPFLAPPRFAIAHSLLRAWLQGSEPLAPGAPRN
jgi:NAD+ diphosphatase